MFINIAHAVEAETKLTYTFPGMDSATVADPGAYIYEVFTFALGIVGLAALAFLVYGGIRYILSAGNPSALADAKDRMTAALIGVVLLLSSYLILNTIDPRLLQLTITDIQPATPDLGSLSPALQAYKNEVLRYIKEGNAAAAAQTMKEVLRTQGSGELRKIQADLAKTEPSAAAATYSAMDRAGQINWLAKELQRELGTAGHVPQLEGYAEMLQQVSVTDLYNIYFGFQTNSQKEIFKQLSDSQRTDLYWDFQQRALADGATQETAGQHQEIYLSQLGADHLARIYQNFQSDGVHGSQLARQIAKTSKGSAESAREVIGIWKRLPPGAERELFLKQVKQAGWSPPINTVTQVNLRQLNPNSSEVEIDSEEKKFVAEWASQ